MKKRTVLAAMAILGVCAAHAATGVTTNGTEIAVCVEAGDTLDIGPDVIGASITKVVKTGDGEATFVPAGVTNTFTAALEIQAGTFSGYRASFGQSSCITVVPGATIKLTGWDAGWGATSEDAAGMIGAGKAEIGGTGVGGAGAFVRTFSSSPKGTFCLFTDLKLTADTLMKTGGGYIGFTRNGTVDMGTHTLTLDGGGRFDFTQGAVKNLGDIVLLSTQINFEGNAVITYDPNPDGKQVVFDGGTLMTWNARNVVNSKEKGIPFGFHVKRNTTFNNIGGSTLTATYNWFSGPVDIDAGKRFEVRTGEKWDIDKRVTFDGPIDNKGLISVTDNGSLWITGRTDSVIGNLEVTNTGGRVVFANLGRATVSNLYAWGSTTTGDNVARLVVTGDTALVGSAISVNKSHYIYLGESAGKFGILELFPGATITNNLRNMKGCGAYYQHGGIMRSTSRASNDMNLGMVTGSYQYMFMGGGDFSYENYASFSCGYGGRSILDMRGGNFRTAYTGGTLSDGMIYFGGGRTHFRQSGGAFRVGQLCFNHDGQGSTGFTTDVTATGTNTTMEAYYIRMNVGNNNAGPNVASLNVNDGATVTAGQIGKGRDWSGGLGAPANTPNCKVYVNFNGGVLRVSGHRDYIFGNADGTSGCEPERITVFEKGAIVDTLNKTVYWTRPFLAPTGRRIKRVTITDATLLQANYGIGPGIIHITSASGAGASAFPIFNPTNRQLSAEAEVTCGGWNYEETPTVSIETPTNVNVTVACAVETEEAPTTGGLTKRGSSTMKLWGVNTYGGATRLEGGTLEFIDANGYPGGDLEVPAATAAALTASSAPLMTATNLVFAAGKGVRVTEADTLDHTTFGRARTIARLANPLADVPSLTLVNTDGTTVASNGEWQLQLADGGTTLKFGPMNGTVMILR